MAVGKAHIEIFAGRFFGKAMKVELLYKIIFTLICGTIVNFGSAYAAEGVVVGVPPFDRDLNILESSHIAAELARNAALGGLTKLGPTNGEPSFSLGLASNVRVASDYSKWSFLIRGDARFQNGEKLSLNDVDYSLRRCRERGRLPQIDSIASRQIGSGVEGGAVQLWIDVMLNVKGDEAKKFPEKLSACPILERESGVLFGTELGHGTNLIGSGTFRLQQIRGGREIELVRMYGVGFNREQIPSIIIRSFADPHQALTALRVGTLDAFFTDDEKVLALSKKDETLTILSCGDLSLVERRGFTLRCPPRVNIEDLKYVYS